MAQQSVDVAGADVLALPDARVELLQHLARRRTGGRWPRQRDHVAVGLRDDAETFFKESQMAVVFPE
jgi:hypothetical protein